MTDNEIIKALECCQVAETISDCDGMECPCLCDGECMLYCRSKRDGTDGILAELCKEALSLINRQKKKIELLNLENLQMIASIKHLKAEAIKEFAERLEKKLFPYGMPDNGNYGINAKAVKVALDKVVKEMVGESNGV